MGAFRGTHGEGVHTAKVRNCDGTSAVEVSNGDAVGAVSYTHLTLPTNREV